MEIRLAGKDEINVLLEIYDRARKFMAETGNPDQWKPTYPGREKICKDMENHACYVCVEKDEIEGVFAYYPGPDPTYGKIENGSWINDAPYGVVHRLASRGRIRGVADFCLEWAFEKAWNLRIDTHRDNRVMQHILEKNGFVRCGTIYVEDGSSRIAFQKVREREYQEVLDYLKSEIREGSLKAGDRLPTERQLSERLSVSRTTVRDAMRLLEGMGILVSRQGSGNYLAGNMERSLSDMLQFMLLLRKLDYRTINQLRRAVGLWAYQEVMAHHTEEQAAELENLLRRMEQEEKPAACDQKFHEKLLEFSGNTLMQAMMKPLSEVCVELIEKACTKMEEKEREQLRDSHFRMIAALKTQEAEKGYQAAREHYDLVDRKISGWEENVR